MPIPERIIIDTSAFYALVSANDDFHEQARQTFESLVDREQEMWTTSYVFVETIALAHRRLGFQPLNVLVETVERYVEVFWVERSLHEAAWRQLLATRGAGLSFVDWTTALAADRLKAHVFTFDKGFAQQGVLIVPR